MKIQSLSLHPCADEGQVYLSPQNTAGISQENNVTHIPKQCKEVVTSFQMEKQPKKIIKCLRTAHLA